MLRRLAYAVLLLMFLVAATLAWLQSWWTQPLAVPAGGYVLRVESGDSLRRISRQLANDQLLSKPRLVDAIAAFTGADQRIRRGEYQLPPGLTPAGLLDLLQSGDTIRYLVTLPEGIRLAEALELLARSDALSTTLTGADDPRLLALVAPATTAEGFFLPETYQYQRGDSDLGILTEAHRMMRETLAEAWAQRRDDLPYTTPYEALIMASIIEKETGLASERALIGGVFVRRLERGMRLQTDPTVIYGLGESFTGNLRRTHLRDKGNPYNSYRHRGLPPGPIALPGRAALQAAVAPAEGDALYFVARGDGSHAFSATLVQHEEAVRQFQLQRRADYRSTPKPKAP